MNVIEYLSKLSKKDFNTNVKHAFDNYDKNYPNICRFEYFRTKYNNKRKEFGIIEKRESPNKADDIKDLIEKDLSRGILEIKKYDKDTVLQLLEPIPTDSFFDFFISKRGGFMRKCVDVTVGNPGAGKTYSRIALALLAKKFNPKLRVGFISCEMRESEWQEEIAADPFLKDIEVVFMINYVGKSNYLELLEEAMKQFDIVIADSFPVIIHHLMLIAAKGTSEKKLIFDLINFFIRVAEENNNNIQLINQVNKDGQYKGGTELPHMVSSLSFVRVENGNRYMLFEKNRNNGNTIQRRLYFTKNKEKFGEIEFNIETYKATYEVIADKKTDIREFLMSKNLSKNNAPSDDTESSVIDRGLGEETEDERQEVDNYMELRTSSEELEINPELSKTGEIELKIN